MTQSDLPPSLPLGMPSDSLPGPPADSQSDRPADSPPDTYGSYYAPFRKPWPLFVRIVIITSVLALLGGGGTVLVTRWVRERFDPPGAPGAEVSLTIPEGTSTNDIARILADNDVIPSAIFARWEWQDVDPFQAGEYVFRLNMSVDEARSVLDGGPIIRPGKSVTIPEGLWLIDIAPRLLDAFPEFNPTELSSVINGNEIRSQFQPESITSLEGLLFPDTYQVSNEDLENEFDLVERMVQQMDSVASELGYEDALEQTGYSAYEVLIIASMIEEEAKVPEDRAKIARVIYNRLEQDIALGIDATILYAHQEHIAELTQSQLEIDSPYNTRTMKGLPPTLIAAPGRKAMEAALNPVEGDWLYYVLASEDGSHFFTDSFEEFQEQVARSRAEGIF